MYLETEASYSRPRCILSPKEDDSRTQDDDIIRVTIRFVRIAIKMNNNNNIEFFH